MTGSEDQGQGSLMQHILKDHTVVAVVGMSKDPHRPSKRVGMYLRKHGYDIIPVNPKYDRIMGMTCYPSLKDIPRKVEVVDVFLNPSRVVPIARDAVEIGAKAIWFQETVVNEEAIRIARDGGLEVVADACMMKEHLKHFRDDE